MVCAKELSIGEYVEFDGQIMEVVGVKEVENGEKGPDQQVKLVLELSAPTGDKTSYVAIASEEFQLEDAPGAPEEVHRRAGVSAESGVDDASLAKWNKVVVEKTDEERARLQETVQANVFFEHLDEIERDELIDVVFLKQFKAGEVLMEEGAEGDLFYILDQGNADIYVLNDEGKQVMVRECSPGDSFGELALMYNAARNATIKARTEISCWCMDRESFKYVILGGSIKKQKKYMGFLDSVKILDTMDKAEKMKLVDALIPRKVQLGTEIVRQGDGSSDMFYIVEQGAVEVFQTNREGKEELVNKKKAGDYFGEISLMTDMPRSATVIASENCILLTLDRKTFVSTLGPLQDILRRNVAVYKTYIDYTKV